jgi:hypothetical protein
VRELPFGQIAFAADPEHDLQIGAALQLGRRGVGQEAEELVRLVLTAGSRNTRLRDPGCGRR